ncbi:NB-ARC domains-containing protein, partial [Tanacetum coccineum]
KKLGRTLSQIQVLLNDAYDKEITDKAVQQWLNGLQQLAYDIDDILNDLATDAMHREFTEQSGASTSKVRKLIPTCCTNFSLSNRIHHKLDNINIRLQDLEKEKKILGLIVKNEKSKDINRKLQTSLVGASSIVGRQGDKEALVQKLLAVEPCNKNLSIVPIVGMGGIGKTTLARLLYNEKEVEDHFELKAWVCVSEAFDSFDISKIIFQSVSGQDKNFADLNLLQEALRYQLREKRFLLVLDDVWSDRCEDWETLVLPFHECAPGSKVIMTTRKENLLNKLGYNHLVHVQRLSHNAAVSLFAQHALGADNFDSHPTLKLHGESIVKKCDGLPLALLALGRLLGTKKDEVEWKDIVDSEVWRLQEVEIIPALRLSYHELPAYLKQLFAYCSLFPKDYSFDKEDLVLLWMAEGFLHQSVVSPSTEERVGHKCFDELFSRSFFTHAPNDKSLFVMHDLMNDLAKFVAGDFFFRVGEEKGKDVRKQAQEKYRHISFVREKYETYKKFRVLKGAASLRTFLAVGVKEQCQKFYLSGKILVDMLPGFPLLRVLSLNGYEISEVPESIGCLKHLRYLNLSQTTIKHLPESICDLYNLEMLIVFGCESLTKLPSNFIKLTNLRHFDIRNTPLLHNMAIEIGELKFLQTLSNIIIRRENHFSTTQLEDSNNLYGKIFIKGLDKVRNTVQNLSRKRLTDLEVEWGDVSDCSPKESNEKEVLDVVMSYSDCLEDLRLVNYRCLEFPNWVGDTSFLKLARVSIHGSKKCASLPPLGQLLSLKELYIQGMEDVKVVGLEFLGNSTAFPSLKVLSFARMPGWEVWTTDSRSGVGDAVFPCLEELSIEDCPNLVEVSLETLPSLRILMIKECGNGVLRSLVHAAPSVRKLEIDSISGLTNEVWRGVILDLEAVDELIVRSCDELRYLWESEEVGASSKVLVNLWRLEVSYCKNLVSLGEKDEEEYYYGSNMLTSLRWLKVENCENLKYCSCPNNIEVFWISLCTSLSGFSSRGGWQKLKGFSIDRCNKELVLINSKTMPMLEYVNVNGVQNLASIIKLGNLIHLKRLFCQTTGPSFPDLQLQCLTSLTELWITACPSTDVPGVWPPNLRKLSIGGLKKLISEWGRQINFPTSVVDLTLYGGSAEGKDEKATNSSELSHILPSSLTTLNICGFAKLERVSKGLQHLTSLQHLYIWGCPKMKELP